MNTSISIYLGLMAYLAAVKIALDLRLIEVAVASQAGFFGWPMIGFLALAGGCAVWLAPRAGCPPSGIRASHPGSGCRFP